MNRLLAAPSPAHTRISSSAPSLHPPRFDLLIGRGRIHFSPPLVPASASALRLSSLCNIAGQFPCAAMATVMTTTTTTARLENKELRGGKKKLFLRAFASPGESVDSEEAAKREQVSKLLGTAARNFRRYGTLGFWGQLVCTVVSAAILAFSVAISGTPTSQATFYATAGGITAAFLSVFWSFGYIRLSERLRETVNNLKKAPPRAEVVKNLQNGIIINLLGMGLTLLGLQATIGGLVAKSLTSSAGPYLQGTAAGYSPVLALDVFLVQASSNTVLSHFLGLVFSMELLRSVTLSPPPPDNVIPKLT